MQQILSEALDLGYVGGIFSLSLCETLPAWFMHLYHCCQLHWNHICRYSAVFLLHSSTEHAMCSHSIRMDKKKEGLAGDLLIVEGICADLLVSFSFSASFTGVFWGDREVWMYQRSIDEDLFRSCTAATFLRFCGAVIIPHHILPSWITSLYPIFFARRASPRKQPASAQLASWLVSSTKNDCVEISGNHCLGMQGMLPWLLYKKP